MPAIHVSPKDSEYGCSCRRHFWRCGCMRVSGIPSPRGVAAAARQRQAGIASPLSTRPRRGHQAPHAYYCRSAHDATVNARLKVLSYNVCFITFAPAQYRLCLVPFPPLRPPGRGTGRSGTPATSRSAQRNNARTLKGAGRCQAPRPRSASSMAVRYMTANFELTERRSGAIGYSVRAYLYRG